MALRKDVILRSALSRRERLEGRTALVQSKYGPEPVEFRPQCSGNRRAYSPTALNSSTSARERSASFDRSSIVAVISSAAVAFDWPIRVSSATLLLMPRDRHLLLLHRAGDGADELVALLHPLGDLRACCR